jgi:hypothetical protein
MGVGGSRRQDRLFISLRSLLPDVEDAMHVFQAAKNGVGFLITADHRRLIRFSADIQRLCGVVASLCSVLWLLSSLWLKPCPAKATMAPERLSRLQRRILA